MDIKDFKGTKGNWITSKVHNFSDTLICYIEPEDGGSIAQTRGQTTGAEAECYANARLMAAAPEMLKILIYLDNRGGLGFDTHELLCNVINKVMVDSEQ